MRCMGIRFLMLVIPAAVACGCARDSSHVRPVVVEVELRADKLCHVRAEALNCEGLGSYLLDVDHLQKSAEIHLMAGPETPPESASKAITSLQGSGYTKLALMGADQNRPGVPR
jgi:biopolymer transport protein ExbD